MEEKKNVTGTAAQQPEKRRDLDDLIFDGQGWMASDR